MVEQGKVPACERQVKLAAYVRRTFAEEELIIDADRLDQYEKYLRFFPYDGLFPWEWFLFTLFMCVFRKDGTPRWPDLAIFVGRGSGKNGFIAFVALCAVTGVNGIENYDVDICANSEDQAKRSFTDLWNIMEGGHRLQLKQGFRWTRTEIVSRTMGGGIRYRTNSPKSKDGMRSGMVVFDEVHAYTSWDNVTVFTTGLGKVAHPRRLFSSSNGNVRDGVYDRLLERCDRILDGEADDNGLLPFVCALDAPEEAHDPAMWAKACPSLPYFPNLRLQIEREYRDWLDNPAESADFMTKRMGLPQGDVEFEVTSWDNLRRASQPNPALEGGRACVLGLDFSRKDDFLSACLLFREKDAEGEDVFRVVHHSWFCLYSRDRSRIRPPLEEWARLGVLTLVDDVEIPTSLPMRWVEEMRETYDVRAVAIDDYRYDIVREALEDMGYSAKEHTIERVRPSHHMRVQPVINSAFATGRITWGEDPAMRWFTNNTKLVPFVNGNYKYEKIEPRSRKTDGFMAMVAAFCIRDQIPEAVKPVFLAPLTF